MEVFLTRCSFVTYIQQMQFALCMYLDFESFFGGAVTY